ncbi:MAG: DUF4838 domain-containing protein [Ileibacterium sp.]|nr:DUF4838 domain-containing protein [Ileibacterium sp.]
MSITYHLDYTLPISDFLEQEIQHYFPAVFQKEAVPAVEADLTFRLMASDEKKDTISIQLENGKGVIASNTPVGLLIAFYRLLQEAGVRFLRPSKKYEVLPEVDFAEFSREFHVEETASYAHRGVCIEGADSYENMADFIDWLPKIGMNAFFIQFENPYSFFKRWYEHEFNPYLEKEPFNTWVAQELSDGIDQEINRRGLSHHRVGHGWTGEVLGYSSKFGWESGLKIPEEKKEYVALINGERELIQGAPILTSLDFAHPEIADMMADSIVRYAKERKDVDCLHVWLSDARNNICECEECQKERIADQYVRILNRIDERLNQEGLDTRICFLLYHELLWAPEKEKINNPDRFVMMFAPITRTFEKSYADVDYANIPETKDYIRNQIVLPNSLEENISYLQQWQKVFEGDSFVYDYPLGRAHYGDLGYMKISKTIYRDAAFLDQLGLNGYIACQELRAGFPHNFPNYVMAKTLWNNKADYEELKEDYFKHLYGSDWKEAVDYLEKLSLYTSCDHFNAIGPREDPTLMNRYKIAGNLALNALDLIADHASAAQGLNKDAWMELNLHRTYVMFLTKALEEKAAGNEEAAQRAWKEVLNYIRLHEKEIQPSLDVYRVIEVAKNYAGFKI